jgi:hypothetical protein
LGIEAHARSACLSVLTLRYAMVLVGVGPAGIGHDRYWNALIKEGEGLRRVPQGLATSPVYDIGQRYSLSILITATNTSPVLRFRVLYSNCNGRQSNRSWMYPSTLPALVPPR